MHIKIIQQQFKEHISTNAVESTKLKDKKLAS